jgi:hypothetical protein
MRSKFKETVVPCYVKIKRQSPSIEKKDTREKKNWVSEGVIV